MAISLDTEFSLGALSRLAVCLPRTRVADPWFRTSLPTFQTQPVRFLPFHLSLVCSVSLKAVFSYRLCEDRLNLFGPNAGPADLPEAHQFKAEVCKKARRLSRLCQLTCAREPEKVIVPLCSVAVS